MIVINLVLDTDLWEADGRPTGQGCRPQAGSNCSGASQKWGPKAQCRDSPQISLPSQLLLLPPLDQGETWLRDSLPRPQRVLTQAPLRICTAPTTGQAFRRMSTEWGHGRKSPRGQADGQTWDRGRTWPWSITSAFKVTPSKAHVVFKSAESFVLWPLQSSLAPGQSQIVLNSGFLLTFLSNELSLSFYPEAKQCVEETQGDSVCQHPQLGWNFSDLKGSLDCLDLPLKELFSLWVICIQRVKPNCRQSLWIPHDDQIRATQTGHCCSCLLSSWD